MTTKTKSDWQRTFVSAGLFRLTGKDKPAIGHELESSAHQLVYSALLSASSKLSKKELVILAHAFDGLDQSCENLIEE